MGIEKFVCTITKWFCLDATANQVFANLAFYGCSTNLVIYLTSVMHQSNAAASTNVSNWNGVGYITPLIGAFLADAYWGRYWASFVFSFIYIIVSDMHINSLTIYHVDKNVILCQHWSCRKLLPHSFYCWRWVEEKRRLRCCHRCERWCCIAFVFDFVELYM